MRKTVLGVNVVLALALASCGDGIGDVTTGGPTGTPTPNPTATPVSTPTPAATPTPGSTGTAACRLAKLPNCDAQCCSAGGSVIYRAEIQAAEDELVTLQPGLFFSNGDVRDNFEYMAALARHIQFRSNGNICTEVLGHDEIRVKGDQNVSQHVDVLISDRSPWVGGAYTCRPASF